MKDWRGTPITVGSRIVYPGRYGSSMWISESIVDEVIETEEERYGRTVKVERLKVTKIRKGRVLLKMPKQSTITRVDRVTVVPHEVEEWVSACGCPVEEIRSRVDNGSLPDSESGSLGSNPGAGASDTYAAKARAVGFWT